MATDTDCAWQRLPWQRSPKGTIWCRRADQTLTVFRRGPGYAWCLHTPGRGPRFSPGAYGSEAEALAAVWAEALALAREQEREAEED
jgi:hypothetical protein